MVTEQEVEAVGQTLAGPQQPLQARLGHCLRTRVGSGVQWPSPLDQPGS